jgi:hypothetical protein
MTKYEVLNQLNQKQLNTKDAYELLFKEVKERKPHRARFVKVKIFVPDSRGASIFLGILLAFPIPIGIIKWAISKKSNQYISEQFQITPMELIELISIRGVKVDIISKDNERVFVKTI